MSLRSNKLESLPHLKFDSVKNYQNNVSGDSGSFSLTSTSRISSLLSNLIQHHKNQFDGIAEDKTPKSQRQEPKGIVRNVLSADRQQSTSATTKSINSLRELFQTLSEKKSIKPSSSNGNIYNISRIPHIIDNPKTSSSLNYQNHSNSARSQRTYLTELPHTGKIIPPQMSARVHDTWHLDGPPIFKGINEHRIHQIASRHLSPDRRPDIPISEIRAQLPEITKRANEKKKTTRKKARLVPYQFKRSKKVDVPINVKIKKVQEKKKQIDLDKHNRNYQILQQKEDYLRQKQERLETRAKFKSFGRMVYLVNFAHYFKKYHVRINRPTKKKNKIALRRIVMVQKQVRRFLALRYFVRLSRAIILIKNSIKSWIAYRRNHRLSVLGKRLFNFLRTYRKANMFYLKTYQFFVKCRLIQKFFRRRLAIKNSRLLVLRALYTKLEELILHEYEKSKIASMKTFKYGYNDRHTLIFKIPIREVRIDHIDKQLKERQIYDFYVKVKNKRHEEIKKIRQITSMSGIITYKTTWDDLKTFCNDNGIGLSRRVGTIRYAPVKRLPFLYYVWKNDFYKLVQTGFDSTLTNTLRILRPLESPNATSRRNSIVFPDENLLNNMMFFAPDIFTPRQTKKILRPITEVVGNALKKIK